MSNKRKKNKDLKLTNCLGKHEAERECRCKCHAPGEQIMHFMPCCSPCPSCGFNER